MDDIQDKLLDLYAEEMNVAASSFEWMGRLLDVDYVKERLKLFELSEGYIYGGGYLGIQLYNTINKFVKIPAVIDKKGELAIDIPSIPVTDAKEFKETYKGQKVIIASIRFYREIRKEISAFVPQNQILFLGELLGGMQK